MKKISFLMIAFLLLGGIAMAQGPQRGQRQMDPKVRAERMTERMVKEYGLNDTQKKQLLEVNQKWVEKMTPRGQNMGRPNSTNQAADSVAVNAGNQKKSSKATKGQRPQMTKEQQEKMWQEMKQSREAYNAQLKNIFTEQQYETYIKKQAERQQPGRRR